MGGRKFRLSTHRKNEERKRRAQPVPLSLIVAIPLQLVVVPALIVSLPLACYTSGHVQSSDSLCARLTSSLSLPPSWIIASTTSLTLCKLRVQQNGQASRADIIFTLSITSELEWTLSVSNLELSPASCPILAEVPHTLSSVAVVHHLMVLLDSTKLCVGNPDRKFIDLWQHRALTLHGSSSK